MSNNSEIDIDTKELEKRVIDDFNKSYNEQQNRYDTLNAFIKAIGKENIKRIHINGNVYYKEDFEKWVS